MVENYGYEDVGIDWGRLVSRYRGRSLKATARAISSHCPELGSCEKIRKIPGFVQAYRAAVRQKLTEFIDADAGDSEIEPVGVSEWQSLIDRKCEEYKKKKRDIDENRIKVIAAGSAPLAIVHFGDPHLDDPGCDLPLLREHIRLVNSTPGVLCGNVGDVTNNWVGRLSKLYAKQPTTYQEAIELSEWFARSVTWAYWVLGNHDHWEHGGTIMRLLLRGATVHHVVDHDARLQFRFNNGVSINLRIRHDWRGRSQYNVAHGAVRGHLFGDRWADVTIGGHTHSWGLWQGETEDGKPRWAARVRGYKRHDDFAAERGFHEYTHGAAAATILNPYAPPTERVIFCWDVAMGLSLLGALRK